MVSASKYSYLGADCVAPMKLFAVTDYSAVDALYTDATIGSIVSDAERIVNTLTNQVFTGTIPDGVVFSTKDIAYRLMYNRILDDGHNQMRPQPKPMKIISDSMLIILKPLIKNKGANRTLWVETG